MFAVLVNASLRNRLLVLIAASILVLYGALTLRGLPVDVFPDLNKPLVTLVTEATGLAPEEVEQLVSAPIEAAMKGMPGVTRVRSVSGTSLSVVYVEFDWGTDVFRNRQVVAERLAVARSSLPRDAQPLMTPTSSYMGEIMLVAVAGDGVGPMELREAAEWIVAPRLMSIPGMSLVVPIGGQVRQYRVTLNPLAMNRLHVTVADLERALENFGSNSGGGFVEQNAQEMLIRGIGRTHSLDDLRNIVVVYHDGHPITLHQVATVAYEPRERRGDAGFMGRSAVVLSVQKQPNADTVTLTRAVETALRDVQTSLPKGVRADHVLFRQADFIEASVGNIQQVLVEAIAVVGVILFLFLFNVRTTLISLLAIPLSVLVTFAVFHWFGLSINTMTLGGLAIAIGELVDDAVVDVENILRRLQLNSRSPDPRPILEVVAAASQEVRSGILYSTFIIILVFVPLFTIPGIEGRLFAPLGAAYIVSILASLLTSITVTPVLCSLLLPRMRFRAGGHESALLRPLKRWNARALAWVLDRPAPLVTVTAFAFAAALSVLPSLPRAFLPPFNEGTLIINLLYDPGISLAESSRMATMAERILLQVPEVRQVGRRTGRAEMDEHAQGVHSTDIEVDLRPGRPYEEVVQDIRTRLRALSATVAIGQPISHRLVDHILTGTGAQIVVKVFGDDLDRLRSIAGDIQRRLATIPGLVDLNVEKQVRVPQLQIRIDYARAQTYGITPGALTRTLEHLASGQVVSQIADGVRRYDVVLRLGEADRTPRGLAGLLVETPAASVPLSYFATIEETDGPNEVRRENGRRRILVTANGDGTNTAGIAAAIEVELARLPLPVGYFTRFEGTYQAQEEAALRLAMLAMVSLALIFGVLYSRYRSVVLCLIVMANVPLALIGSVAALRLTGIELSVASMIGFITLTGIATRNGILKVSHYINLVLHEGETFGRAMIIRGSQERMTPVLMTALSAGFALIPLMIQAHAPGKEILHPVAVVIFGGLVSATLLDALMTPLLFHRFGERPLRRLVEAGRAGCVAEAF